MKINKNSWHYKYNQSINKDIGSSENICDYLTSTIMNLSLVVVVFPLVVMIFLTLFLQAGAAIYANPFLNSLINLGDASLYLNFFEAVPNADFWNFVMNNKLNILTLTGIGMAAISVYVGICFCLLYAFNYLCEKLKVNKSKICPPVEFE